MKNFKDILSEVAQPKSAEEKRFKDQHTIELVKHPVAPDSQFTGEIEGVTKQKRLADPAEGEDAAKYDQAYAEKDKPFKMPRNVDESVEELDEGIMDKVKAGVKKVLGKYRLDKAQRKASSELRSYYDDWIASGGSEERFMELVHGTGKQLSLDIEPEEMLKDWLPKVRRANRKDDRLIKLRMKKESVELDEAEFSNWSVEIPKQQGIDKKHTVTVKARNTREAAKKAAGRVGLGDRWMSMKLGKVTKLGMAEEVEEIDEISKKTLGSYVNKASKSAAHSYGMAFRRFGRGTRKDDAAGDELEKKANKRLAGIATATKKLTKEGMSFKNLLDKIVAEEVEDIYEAPQYVSEDPQEEIPMMMRQLHFIGYAADEIMEYLATADDPEEWYQNKLANAFAMMKTLHAYVEGDKRMGSDVDMDDLEAGYIMSGYYGEETELEEANFKPSNLKLKNGDMVKISMADAKTLNDMMNTLNPKNRKEMEATLMKDKKGFEEILSFAKEAM